MPLKKLGYNEIVAHRVKIWVMGEEQAPITWTIPVIEHGNFVRTDRVVLNHHKKDTTTKKVKTRK